MIRRTMAQSTAPRRSCARRLEIDVKTMLAIEVPSARCIMLPAGSPCRAKEMTSSGTMTSPPPTPSKPASRPATAPMPRYTSATASRAAPYPGRRGSSPSE